MQKKDVLSEELKITDQPVEFKCSICDNIVTLPSPESATVDLNTLLRAAMLMECTKCHQIVCKQCIGDKKEKICKNCI